MCGICGILSFSGDNLVSEPLLLSMRDAMTHRGPDGAGFFVSHSGRVGLGHRRLSIIDLKESGKQPMSNEDGSVWITFNGEIYNFQSLKEDLIKKGHHFKSTSDTEVIIHLYEDKGIDCIHELQGMFAFALWDSNISKLFLVRDRIGIKPLYYTVFNNQLLFASEIKAILKQKDLPRKVNGRSLYHYLTFMTTPSPETMFEGIDKLPAGWFAEITLDGMFQKRKYWDVLDKTDRANGCSEGEIAQTLLDLLRKTVNEYKISDVPVGIFLSGGIDSSTNAVLFSEKENNPIKTFSIGYEGEYSSYTNELEYARLISKMIRSEHHEKILGVDDLVSFLDTMVFSLDEPNADPVCFPVYYVSSLARQNNVTVCQVGEGSDELFWGYPQWRKILLMEKIGGHTPKIIKKLALSLLRLAGKQDRIYYDWIQRSLDKRPVYWGVHAFTEYEKGKVFSDHFIQKIGTVSSYDVIAPFYSQFNVKFPGKSQVKWMTYLDLNQRLPELLLMRVDKMSMATSLEARVPFLDHTLVQFAMSIPPELITKNYSLKHILKTAVRDILPSTIIQRKKQGFAVPIYEWYYTKLGAQIQQQLLDFCDKTTYFNKSAVMDLIRSKKYEKLWVLYIFVKWHETYIDHDATCRT